MPKFLKALFKTKDSGQKPETPGMTTPAPVTETMPFEIHVPEFAQLRDSGEKFTLLDVREPWEIQTASIPGSVNIPMGDIPRRQTELNPEEHIIVMCHHGMRSANVTMFLRQQGFEKAQSLAGGIDRYAREVDPSVGLY